MAQQPPGNYPPSGPPRDRPLRPQLSTHGRLPAARGYPGGRDPAP